MQKIKKIGTFGLTGFVLFLASSTIVFAQTVIKEVHADSGSGNIVIQSTSPVRPRVQTFSGAMPRVVIDLDNASLDNSLKNNKRIADEVSAAFPMVKKFMLSEYGTGLTTVRIVLNVEESNFKKIKVASGDNNRISINMTGSGPVGNDFPHMNSAGFRPDEGIGNQGSNGSYSGYDGSLREELVQKDRKIRELMTDIEFLKQQSSPRVDVDSINREVNSLKSENYRLKEELANTKGRLVQAASKLTTAGSLSEELERAKNQIEELSRQLMDQAQNSPPPGYEQEVSKLRGQLDEAIAKIRELSEEKTDIDKIKHELNQARLDLSAAHRQIDSMGGKDYQSLQAQLQEAKTSVNENEIQLKKALSVIDALREKVEMTAAVSQENKNYESELYKAKVRIAELERTGNSATEERGRAEQLEEDLRVATKQLETVNNQLREANNEIASMREQMGSVDSKSEALAQAETQLGIMATQLAMAQEKVGSLEIELENKIDKQSIESTNKALEEKGRELEVVRAQLTEANNAKEQMALEQKNLQDLNSKLQQDNTALAEQISKVGGPEIADKYQKAQNDLNEARNLLEQTKNQLKDYAEIKERFETVNRRVEEESLKAQEEARKSSEMVRINEELTKKVEELSRALSAAPANERLTISPESGQPDGTMIMEGPKGALNAQALKEQLSVASSVILNQSEELTRLQNELGALRAAQISSANMTSSAEVKPVSPTQPDNKKALELYQKAVEFRKNNGDVLQTISMLQQITRQYPNFVRSYVVLGEVYLDTGELDKATESLKTALLLDPDNNAAHHFIGNVYFAQGNYGRAIEEFKLAIGINALTNYGSTLKNQGNIDAAITTYKAVLELSPNDPDLHYNLAVAYKAKNMIDDAIAEYKQAINIRPDFSNAHYNLALLLAQNGNNGEAIEHFEEYLKFSPNSSDADRIRAIISQLQG